MNADQPKYKVVNGTSYSLDTPDEVVRVLEDARRSQVRLAINYKTESQPKFGRVSRSTGDVRIPILVHNARSLGGFFLCSDGIVEIRESASKRLLYKATEAL